MGTNNIESTGPQHRQFSPYKSYYLGIPIDESAPTQQPIFKPRSAMTIHGATFLGMKISNILDLIENKQPKILLKPGRNYLVYEIDEAGRYQFWGQFTPKPAPAPRAQPVRRLQSGMSDRVSNDMPPSIVPIYGAQQPAQSENYGRAKERETYENHIKSLETQLTTVDSRYEKVINQLNTSHREELERQRLHQEQVEMFFSNQNEELSKKYDTLEADYYSALEAKGKAEAALETAKADLESTKTDFFRQLKLAEEKFKFEIQKRDDTDKIQKKLDAQVAQSGLNDGNGIQGIIDGAMKLFPLLQAAGIFGNNTIPQQAPTQQPSVVHNPAQNLNGVQTGNPPPKPKPIPLPQPVEGVQA